MIDQEFKDTIEQLFKKRDDREIEKLASKQEFRKRFEGILLFKCQLCGKISPPRNIDMVDSVDSFLNETDGQAAYDLSPREHSCDGKFFGTTGQATYIGIYKRTE